MMLVCVCKNVSEQQVHQAVARGHDTMKSLCDELGVMGQCGKCAKHAREILRGSQPMCRHETGQGMCAQDCQRPTGTLLN